MTKIIILIKNNWFILSLFTLAAITVCSLFPLPQLPPLPGTDKTRHLIAYGVLMFPTALRKPDKWILIGIFFIAYSGLIELVQPLVNRYGEWPDLAVNAAGIVSGVVVAELTNLFIKVTEKRFG